MRMYKKTFSDIYKEKAKMGRISLIYQRGERDKQRIAVRSVDIVAAEFFLIFRQKGRREVIY